MNRSTLALIVSGAAAIATASASGTPMFRIDQFFLGANEVSPGSFYSGDIVPRESLSTTDGNLLLSSINGNFEVMGLNNSGQSATLSVDYDAYAEVFANAIKASSSLSGVGPLINENNAPFVDDEFNIDTTGVPEAFSLSSYAYFSDAIEVEGGAGLHSIKFDLALDGLLTSSDPTAGAANSQVRVAQGFFGPLGFSGESLFATNGNGTINQTFSTESLEVQSGMVSLGISLQTDTDLFFGAGTFPELEFATSDFSNTLNFGQVAGFDINGNPVDLISAQSSSGSQFQTLRVDSGPLNPVPTPAVLPLLVLGLAGLGLVRRFKAAVRV